VKFVFPEPDDYPSSVFEFRPLPPITHPVVLDLLFPPSRMRFRQQEVSRAAMPKAAINEHTYPGSTKNDVSVATEIDLWTRVKSIPQARFVKRAPEQCFGARVF
jgi:hypothetical protein